MAKKRRRAATSVKTKIIRASAPSPIIRVQQAAAPVRRSRRRRSPVRRNSVGGAVGGIVSNETIQMAIGGALYGFAVKSGLVAKLPAIPVVGRTGTAAILLDYFSRRGGGPWVGKAARAAACIAGYQLGAEGAIQGDFMMGNDDATTPGSVNADDMDGDDGYE
jgi:hypothetical protein